MDRESGRGLIPDSGRFIAGCPGVCSLQLTRGGERSVCLLPVMVSPPASGSCCRDCAKNRAQAVGFCLFPFLFSGKRRERRRWLAPKHREIFRQVIGASSVLPFAGSPFILPSGMRFLLRAPYGFFPVSGLRQPDKQRASGTRRCENTGRQERKERFRGQEKAGSLCPCRRTVAVLSRVFRRGSGLHPFRFRRLPEVRSVRQAAFFFRRFCRHVQPVSGTGNAGARTAFPIHCPFLTGARAAFLHPSPFSSFGLPDEPDGASGLNRFPSRCRFSFFGNALRSFSGLPACSRELETGMLRKKPAFLSGRRNGRSFRAPAGVKIFVRRRPENGMASESRKICLPLLPPRRCRFRRFSPVLSSHGGFAACRRRGISAMVQGGMVWFRVCIR